MARDRLAAVRAQSLSSSSAPTDFHPHSRSPSLRDASYATPPTHNRSRSVGSGSNTSRRIASANNSYDELNSPDANDMPRSLSDYNPFSDDAGRAWDPPRVVSPAHTHERGFSNPFENITPNQRLPVNGGPASFRPGHGHSASSPAPYSPMTSVRSRVQQFDPSNRDSIYSSDGSPMTQNTTHWNHPASAGDGQSAPFYPGPAYIAGAGNASPTGRPRMTPTRPSFRTTRSYTSADLSPPSPQPVANPFMSVDERMADMDEMERFFEEISGIQSATRTYGDNVTRIETLHSRSLNTLPDSPEYTRVQTELDRITDEAQSLSNDVRDRIKMLERTNGRAPTPQDANVKRTQTASIKNRFIEAIQRYSQVEAAHRAASRARLGKQYRIVNPGASEDEVRRICEDPDAGDAIFRQGVLNSNRNGDARAALSAVQARHADILQIEKTIVELAQLFQDMAVMVEEQDEGICQIEQNAVQAETDMEMAHGELVQAKTHAKSARSKRKWCFAIFMVILVIVAGIVVYFVLKNHSFGNKNNNNSNDQSDVATSGSQAAVNITPMEATTITQTSVLVSVVTEIVTATPSPTRSPSSSRSAKSTSVNSNNNNNKRYDNLIDHMLPRAMNWEQRARAWPFVDMEADADTVDQVDDLSAISLIERSFVEDVAPPGHHLAGSPWPDLLMEV